MESEKLKYCYHCGKEIPVSSFGKNRTRPDGLHSLCKEGVRSNGKRYFAENKDKIYARCAVWRKHKRSEESKERARKTRRNYRKSHPPTPDERMAGAIRCGIAYTLSRFKQKKNRTSWTKFVTFTKQELRDHIERLFQPGMSWDNFGVGGWSVDHIVPISAFDIPDSNCEAFKRYWSLENLRPMWYKDNHDKLDRLTEEAIQLIAKWEEESYVTKVPANERR